MIDRLINRLFPPSRPSAPDYARFPDLPDVGLEFDRKAVAELRASRDRLKPKGK